MPQIKSIKQDITVDLNLKKLDGHEGWIGYELRIFLLLENNHKEFLRPSEEELYFECHFEYEIPELCKGLRGVVDKSSNVFEFQPIDEKDFLLKLLSKDDYFEMELWLHKAKLLERYKWYSSGMIGVKFEVNEEKINQFINEIETDYYEVIN